MMKTMTLTMALMMALAAGCAPMQVTSNMEALSSHSLSVGADRQVDVIWVQQFKDGKFLLMRCSNTPEGPACLTARTP